ncbi:hypothetical protein AAC387_Pa05g0876 [Persea americana]
MPHVRSEPFSTRVPRSNFLGPKLTCRFLFRFTGKDEEVNLLGDGTERPEFSEWSWMTPQQLLDLVVSYKKPVYEEILRTFTPHFH